MAFLQIALRSEHPCLNLLAGSLLGHPSFDQSLGADARRAMVEDGSADIGDSLGETRNNWVNIGEKLGKKLGKTHNFNPQDVLMVSNECSLGEAPLPL